MPRRKEHNIESNCVTFEDDCYNEQSQPQTYQTMYNYETKLIKDKANQFIDYLKEKVSI